MDTYNEILTTSLKGILQKAETFRPLAKKMEKNLLFRSFFPQKSSTDT